MIKKILGLIFNRWVMAILGLIALGLIIWFVGPLIAIGEYRPLESETIRWALIGLIVAIWLGQLAWKLIKAKTANAKLFDGLLRQTQAQAPEAPGAEEVATLRQRFEEAVGVLKQAKLGGREKKSALGSLFGRQYVYELPWYIFIGAPGSGKTTALINSGLKFPLADRFGEAAIRGVGGTRNCDWWFTDEAVLLDTAGRYTTQESNQQVDSAAWSGFLQLLKKFRPRRPINGVLLTVSVADLLQQSPTQREGQANALRKRIQELHEQLGIRFPLYVLVTKTDLLAGFMEFFGELGAEERAQVWGTSFPFGEKQADAPIAAFPQEFVALEQRINDRLIDRLQQERDPQRRALLYTFPQQFAGLRDVLNEFLDRVFSPSRFEEKPLLRGIYFTSGTQEGSPIDRVMGTLGRAFRLERKLLPSMRPSGKSFFITRLLRDVIFPEAGLAGSNLKWERRRAALQWSGLALATLISIAGILVWSLSYSRNKAYVAEVQGKVSDVTKQVDGLTVSSNADVVSLLPILQSVRELARTPTVAGSVPTSMGFGLYQGEKLTSAANGTYQRLLNDAFLPRLSLRVEQQMTAFRNNPEALYETLKAYLMLHDTAHFDGRWLTSFIEYDWDNNLPREVTAEQREALKAHLRTLLERGAVASPVAQDEGLVASVRATIASLPLAKRIYNRIRQEGVGEKFPEFTIPRAVGAQSAGVFRRQSGKSVTQGVVGLYSYDAYYQAFQPAAKETTKQLADEEGWVLGVKEGQKRSLSDLTGTEAVFSDVRKLYLEDYGRTWEEFVRDIRVDTGGSDTRSLIQAATVLSAADSPLPVLLRAIVKEVTLVKKADADKTLLDKGEEEFKKRTEKFKSLFGGAKPKSTQEIAALPETIVDDRFDALRRLVTPPGPGQPAPIDTQIALMKEIAQAMVNAKAAIDAGTPPPTSPAPQSATLASKQAPEPLASILKTLADGAANLIARGDDTITQGKLGPLAEFCNRAISGRYPFVKGSTRDVTQEDFGTLFSPGGGLDKFFVEELARKVDTSKSPWVFRQTSDARGQQSSAALVQFQRAATIRDVFFRSGGKTPALKLDFKPIEMDTTITQFILDVDGQIVKYSHGPQVIQPVQWPGTKGSSQVRLQITPPPSASGVLGPFEGPWALFHMFDHLQITPTSQPEKFNVTFNFDGRKAQFEVVTSSVQNPFRLRELEQFQCPGKL